MNPSTEPTVPARGAAAARSVVLAVNTRTLPIMPLSTAGMLIAINSVTVYAEAVIPAHRRLRKRRVDRPAASICADGAAAGEGCPRG